MHSVDQGLNKKVVSFKRREEYLLPNPYPYPALNPLLAQTQSNEEPWEKVRMNHDSNGIYGT